MTRLYTLTYTVAYDSGDVTRKVHGVTGASFVDNKIRVTYANDYPMVAMEWDMTMAHPVTEFSLVQEK